MKRYLLLACAVVLAIPAVPAPVRVAYALPAVSGGGSSFAFLEIDQWRSEVGRAPYNLTLNYQPSGSGQGRRRIHK